MATSLKWRQSKIFRDLERFIILIAGRRWSKTTTLLVKFVHRAYRQVGDYAYFAPTYRQAKLIAWQKLKKLIDYRFIQGRPNETELSIPLVNGSTIRLFGLDKPESILGIKLDGALIDEYDQIKANVYESVIRPALADTGGFCWFSGTPDSRKKRLKELIDDVRLNGRKEYSIYQYKTTEGGYVPDEELALAKQQMDERTYREQFEATFLDLLGQVYYGFSFDDNVQTYAEYNPRLPIRVLFDFNVDPFCVGFAHSIPKQDTFRNPYTNIHVFDELAVRNSNTPEMCRAILKKYENHRAGIIVYGDATGQSRHTQSSLSDYQIITDMFKNIPNLSLRIKSKNPDVKDRINAVNSILKSFNGTRHLFINPRCKKIIKDLLNVTYKEGTGDIDKTDLEQTHFTDGLGYYVEYEHPVNRGFFK